MLDKISTPAHIDTARPIVIFSRGLGPNAGGLEIFNSNLMAALSQQGAVSHVPHQSNARLVDYFTRFWKTLGYLRKHKDADLLVQYGSFLDILMLPLLRIFSDRIWVIAHVSDAWVHVRSKLLFRITTIVLTHCARQVFVLADQQASVFRATGAVKIHTIIGEAFASPAKKVCKPEGFAFLGRVVAEKGVLDLVTAWGDARIADLGLKLRIYGAADAKMRERIDAQIEARGLGNRISLEGPVKGDPAVIEVIDDAVALLYPSYADAFPLVMIESFARGTPCLVSNVGEGPSFVDAPHLIVVPGDIAALTGAILYLAANELAPDYLSAMQRKARRFATGQIVADLQHHGAIQFGGRP